VNHATAAQAIPFFNSLLDDCFSQVPHAPQCIGLLIASQWQGSLLWWSFDPRGDVESFVEDSLNRFVSTLVRPHPEDSLR
jgi:hypothetical protein